MLNAQYVRIRTDNAIASLPAATAAIESAFPDRFLRDPDGDLTEIDNRPVNFASENSQPAALGLQPLGAAARLGGAAGAAARDVPAALRRPPLPFRGAGRGEAGAVAEGAGPPAPAEGTTPAASRRRRPPSPGPPGAPGKRRPAKAERNISLSRCCCAAEARSGTERLKPQRSWLRFSRA